YYGGGYDAHGTNQRISWFAQDSWRINDRFTLNPGVRIDINRGSVPTLGTVFKTNPVPPRVCFAWDVEGNGKTIVRAHYGRYYEALYSSFYYYMEPGAFFPQLITRTFNTSGFAETVSYNTGQKYAIDPHIKQPRMDQYVIGMDRELPFNIVL